MNNSLLKLKSKNVFESWNILVDDNIITLELFNLCKKVYYNTIDELIKVSNNETEKDYLPILQNFINQFNQLDEEHDHFIETVERDDICNELDEMVLALNLDLEKINCDSELIYREF